MTAVPTSNCVDDIDLYTVPTLETVFESMADIVVVLDGDGRYVSRAPGCDPFLYMPWDKLKGKTIYDVFEANTAADIHDAINQCLHSSERQAVEYCIYEAGGLRWFSSTISRLTPKLVLLVCRDTTLRRKQEEKLHLVNSTLEAILNGTEDAIFLLSDTLMVLDCNAAFRERHRLNGNHNQLSLADVFGSDKAEYYGCLIREVFTSARSIRYEWDHGSNGSLRYFETEVSPVKDKNGGVTRAVGISRDITNRKQMEIALRRSEHLYAAALAGSNDGIWEWDLSQEKVFFSARAHSIFHEDESFIGVWHSPEKWFAKLHVDDSRKLKHFVQRQARDGQATLQHEQRIVQPDGSYRWYLVKGARIVDNSQGGAIKICGSISDIHHLKVTEQQLRHRATHDALTGIPNRVYFLDYLARILKRTQVEDYEKLYYAVLFLDLDNFKLVNDSLGHSAGDRLLKATVKRIQKALRPGDVLARLGGDEFAVLLDHMEKPKDATHVAMRIIKEVSTPLSLHNIKVHTTTSIGITFGNPRYIKPEDLLRDADNAMYQAKESGKNSFRIFDNKMHVEVMQRLELEADLQLAIKREEFFLCYQTIQDAFTEKVVGVEALIRWNHPQRGVIFPNEFIPIAEEIGLIIPIGNLVLHMAIEAISKINQLRPDNDPLQISINFSIKQFLDPGIVDKIRTLMQKYNVPPKTVGVEVVESLLHDKIPSIGKTLDDLRATGLRLDLDDFGTGYSSLAYIQKYPLDRLKIDRMFVSSIESDPVAKHIVTAIIDLSKALNANVLAEGVETKQQWEILREMGCDLVQGYYFHKPETYDKVLARLGQID